MRTDASSVGSLDTLHATDGLVHTIPGTYRYMHTLHPLLEVCILLSWMCTSRIPRVVSALPLYLVYAVMHLMLDHWIHYMLQMVRVPYHVSLPDAVGTV